MLISCWVFILYVLQVFWAGPWSTCYSSRVTQSSIHHGVNVIPLSDSPLICTVPTQWLVILDTIIVIASSIIIIISYHIVVCKWQNRLKVGTDKPKLKVKCSQYQTFRWRRKVYSDWEDVTASDRVFHYLLVCICDVGNLFICQRCKLSAAELSSWTKFRSHSSSMAQTLTSTTVACRVYFMTIYSGLTSLNESSTSSLSWSAGVWRTKLRSTWVSTAIRLLLSAADIYD